jgi:Cdc6-like AAA superfamily ATPase
MVTGSPGLGKTVSVGKVLSSSDCSVLAINANIVRSLREVQQLIFEHLTGIRPSRILST